MPDLPKQIRSRATNQHDPVLSETCMQYHSSHLRRLLCSATIVSDSVAQSAISQLISASIAPRAVTVDLVMWVLGMLAVIGLLVVGGITKSKTIVSSGLGYVVGFLYSAWILNAWWTIMLEACMLLLFLLSFAILSE
jgi:hypothetical protein